MKVIQQNVKATKIKFDNGIAWQVGGKKYPYGWAYSKDAAGGSFDVLHTPEGTELTGDIVELSRPGTDGRGNLIDYGPEICFQPHEGQVSPKDAAKWRKDHWIKCFGDDEHYYGDVESVTYKDPKSKTGKLRTDKCYGISIQREVNVIVYRKNGKRPTMSIPIENVVERHLKTYE